jgi:glycerol-3-phosphate acyltransferase PlsY
LDSFRKFSRALRPFALLRKEASGDFDLRKRVGRDFMIMAWTGQIQSVNTLHAFVCLVGAYVLGCLGIGYYLVRAQTGRDLREIGTGSIGARNVGRVLGTGGFSVTLLADFAKGVLAVWAVRQFSGSEILAGLAMLTVTVGHVWPVQLGFRGGKGAATSIGGLLVLNWHSALIYAAVFVVLFVLLRRAILPGLFAYLILPFTVWWFCQNGLLVLIVTGLITVVWFAHRENLIAEITQLAGHRYRPFHPNKPRP